MKKNKNIDVLSGIAVLLVLFSHLFELVGFSTHIAFLDLFISYGGVIGVSLFLILSGFGIYNHFNYYENNSKKESYFQFILGRLKKIGPQYYFSLLCIILLSSGAVYLSKDHLVDIISHIFFVHNLNWLTSGSISGVCWIIALIFQFYLIAPIIYKLIKKYSIVTLISSFVVSILAKFLIFHFLLVPTGETDIFFYFTYGNQLITSLAFFATGMFLGKILSKNHNIGLNLNIVNIIVCTVMLVCGFLTLKLVTFNGFKLLNNTGLYTDCTFAYIWHFILLIVISIFIYFFAKIKFSFEGLFSKTILFISKYGYGIYIWHLVIINNLIANSSTINGMVIYHPLLAVIVLSFVCVLFGFIMTKIVESFDCSNYIKDNKKVIINCCLLIFIFSLLFILWKVFI